VLLSDIRTECPPSSSSHHSSHNSVSERSGSLRQPIVQLGNPPVNSHQYPALSANHSGSSSGTPSTGSLGSHFVWDFILDATRERTYEDFFPHYTDSDLHGIFSTASQIYKSQTSDHTGTSAHFTLCLNYDPNILSEIAPMQWKKMRQDTQEHGDAIRREDMDRLLKDGLSSDPPVLDGFIVSPTKPWHRMHNYDLHRQILSEHQRAFDNGDDVRDTYLATPL
jgi:hypothetical protein